MVLAAGDRARELCERPAWIRGIDHRTDAHTLGVRDFSDAMSARIAAEKAGVHDGPVDFAELHAPFTTSEHLLTQALGLGGDTVVNPSGGALAAHTMMASGLIRIGEAATRITNGDGDRAVAHATAGPCLQQNLVCVLEGD
jgi:acetyl-CoA acetyltransferase